MKKHIYTYILNNTPLRLLLLLVIMAGGVTEVVGQDRRYWDFTKWSDATVANLKADAAASSGTGWSDDEKGDGSNIDATKDNCFWAITTPNANGELLANGVVIEELKGLKFGENVNNRGLAIAVNYPSTSLGTYHGPAYLWLGGSNKQFFTIPNVKGGSTIKMGVESHKVSDARGVDLLVNGTSIGKFEPTAYEEHTWNVSGTETVDIVVDNTNGCHIYFIEVESAKYTYTVNEIVGGKTVRTTVGSGNPYDIVDVQFRKYNEFEGSLYYYELKNNNPYKYPVTLDENNKVINLQYTNKEKDIDNVVFLCEVEDIDGVTRCGSSSADARSSNAAAAYVAAGKGKIKLTTLNRGTYKLSAVFFNPTSGTVDWRFYTDDKEITNYYVNTNSHTIPVSLPVFVIENDDTPIYIGEAGGNNNGIDYIYIQRIGDAFDILKWAKDDGKVATSVTIDISEINNDNLNNSKKDLPTHLLNSSGKSITYGSSNTNVASFYGNETLPRIKGVGTTVITAKAPHATYGENVDVATYTLNVKGATNVRGDYDKENNTYSFNRPGQTLNTATISIDGISMTYGNNGSTAVLVKSDVGPALKIIDANGFSHPNLNDGVIPVETEYGGTFYKFTPTIDGELTIIGQLDNPVVYRSDNMQQTVRNSNNKTMTVSLGKDRTYYLYNSSTALLLHSFSYKPKYSVKFDYRNKIKVDGTPTIDGFAFNNGTTLTPVLKVYDNVNGGQMAESRYRVTSYSIDNSTHVEFVNGTGVLTTKSSATDGETVKITATVQIGDETIKKTFTLMMIAGFWDFSKYSTTYHDQLKTVDKNNGVYDNDIDVWSESATNTYIKARDTENFEYMLRAVDSNGENENEPIEIARALQSRYSVRWMRQTPGFFYLFGYNNTKYSHGGVIKVPVQKGMIIEIKGYSDSEYAPMLINNDGDPSHTDTKLYSAVSEFDYTPITRFYIDKDADIYRYIVTNPSEDGFLYIINPSFGLPFSINHIRLTEEILFEYNTETFTDGKELINPILNSTGNTFTYKIINDGGGLCTKIDTDGKVTIAPNKYGTYEIEVIGESGELKGVIGRYKVHVVGMEAENPAPRISDGDELEWTPDELKKLISILYGQVSPTEEELKAFKDKVEFSEYKGTEDEKYTRPTSISKVTFKGETGNQTLTIEGTGEVKIQVRLGNIVKVITFDISGVALENRTPVYPCSATKAEIKVTGSDSDLDNIKFETEWMLENLLGELREHSSDLRMEQNGNILTISRENGEPFGYGGAIPIKVTNGDNPELTGMLTIAYSSHSWKFDSNMLVYNHPTYNGVYDFYTDGSEKLRTGKWNENSTFDKPIDDPIIPTERKWKFIRKMGSNNPNTDIIYAYLNSVDGDNAKILPETAGLLISSEKNSDQFGVEMLTTRKMVPKPGTTNEEYELGDPNIVDIDADFDGISDATGYDMQNVMLSSGGELAIPYVKPGQWIEMRWYRHTPDKGERMTLTNLCDVTGTLITEPYLIGNTEQGTYMFQVDPKLKEDDVNNVVIHIMDAVFVSIQEVILHEPGWEYKSSMNEHIQAEGGKAQDKYIGETSIKLGGHKSQIAPNAPANWSFIILGNLGDKAEIINATPAVDNYKKPRPGYYEEDEDVIITVKDGWGKIYATLNSYTSDYLYVANRKTWVITFGKAPAQEYPYTWDFTKYFASTKNGVGGSGDDVYEEDPNYDASNNPTGSHELRININTWNNEENDEMNLVTTGYYDANYGSFFVDGAQLVSYGLRDKEKYNGCIPETAGLGFRLLSTSDYSDSDSKVVDSSNVLKLDMRSTSEGKQTADENNCTWRDGKLSIHRGGSIIVPRPTFNEKESTKKAEDFYIYVRSSEAPANVSNTDESAEVIAEGLYKYRFKKQNEGEPGDVELKFEGNVDIYAIAVTDMFKEMTALSGATENEKTGWATESRDRTIDHTLTGYLSNNPTQAYAIVESDGNPVYSDSKNQTVVALEDRRNVVPKDYGLVMRQTENVPAPIEDQTTGKVYKYPVPLFVPAVTTAEDDIWENEFNLMRPNVNETVFDSEEEHIDSEKENAVDDEYTRFILANHYMTWKRQDGEVTEPNEFVSGDVAAFYRLHVFGTDDAYVNKTDDEINALNTLKANSAYLLLRTSEINEALWNQSSGNSRQYIGIKGVSDMFDDTNEPGTGGAPAEMQGIYSLSGQKLNPGSKLAPGIYIINGKKIIIGRNNDK